MISIVFPINLADAIFNSFSYTKLIEFTSIFLIFSGNSKFITGFLNNSFFSSFDFKVILNSTLLFDVIADNSVLFICKSADVSVSIKLIFDSFLANSVFSSPEI